MWFEREGLPHEIINEASEGLERPLEFRDSTSPIDAPPPPTDLDQADELFELDDEFGLQSPKSVAVETLALDHPQQPENETRERTVREKSDVRKTCAFEESEPSLLSRALSKAHLDLSLLGILLFLPTALLPSPQLQGRLHQRQPGHGHLRDVWRRHPGPGTQKTGLAERDRREVPGADPAKQGRAERREGEGNEQGAFREDEALRPQRQNKKSTEILRIGL